MLNPQYQSNLRIWTFTWQMVSSRMTNVHWQQTLHAQVECKITCTYFFFLLFSVHIIVISITYSIYLYCHAVYISSTFGNLKTLGVYVMNAGANWYTTTHDGTWYNCGNCMFVFMIIHTWWGSPVLPPWCCSCCPSCTEAPAVHPRSLGQGAASPTFCSYGCNIKKEKISFWSSSY